MADKKKYVDVKDVALIRVGTWDASTGESSITREDLDNIVEASKNDNLNLAVLKVGHTDPRFENPDWDGDPAYGQVTNLRVTDDKDGTLVGDFVNVPEDLAEKLESAYPYRSVEISWGVKLKDQRGKVVEEFPAVLTGVALLGRSEPAVSGLGTVHADLAKDMTATKVTAFSTGPAMFAFPGGLTNESLRRVLQSALWETAGGDPYMDAWVDDFDDTRVWFHRDGKVWQSAYAVEGGDVTFQGDPVEVVEKRVFEPVAGSTAAAGDTLTVPHAKSRKNDSDPEPGAAGSMTVTKETSQMAFTDKQLGVLRKQYKLADDATEEQVVAAIAAKAEADAAEAAEAEAEADKDNAGNVTNLPPKPDREPVAAAAAPGAGTVTEPTPSVTLSKAQWEAHVASQSALAAQVKALTDKADKDRRDRIIHEAFTSGRLHSTEREAWRAQLDENETTTVALLSARQPMFPVTEVGHDSAPFAMSTSTALSEAQIKAENALFGIEGDK